MADPLKKNPLDVLVFRISSPCGRIYELPLKKVEEDYIDYLVEADKITPEEASKDMTKDNIYSWFMEQFNWDDVDRYATLVQEASPKQIQEALDLLRRSSHPPNKSKLMVSPALVADFDAANLNQSTPTPALKSRRRRV